tara:strand:- start:22 stop:792 length:771 start_codon:yes stop_codon:yes gene_type:complete
MILRIKNAFKSLLILASLSLIFPQTIRICDSISKVPLSDVNIFIEDKGATSDKNGLCDISNFGKNELISFSLIGYETKNIYKSQITNTVYLDSKNIPMNIVKVSGRKKKHYKRYLKLERDVKKVYPYALTISKLLNNYDRILDSLENESIFNRYSQKRKIFKKIEDGLLSKYGQSMRKLTRNQGRILVRLVDRETGRTSYNIIKDFRNLFSASFWQITARIFGNNLKSYYNPKIGEDRLIEFILNKSQTKSNQKKK